MIIVGNWKMNMGFRQAVKFLAHFNRLIKEKELGCFIFFPSAPLSLLFQKEGFYWGGQNVYHQPEGAWTGETSAKTLKEMGASFCLLGHSERRYVLGESDVEVEKKFHLLLWLALIPVLCIGENLSDRFEKTKILQKQLSWIKNYKKYQNLPWKPEQLPQMFKHIPLIVAYEPLWSIGTGDIPSTQEIDEAAQFIKEYLSLPSVQVFYGGSVDKNTAKKFSGCSFIDGLLVGGASLDPDHLYSIYQESNYNNKTEN